ncbi:hypothetical protein SK128_018534, partial [Halocaridina rubra]
DLTPGSRLPEGGQSSVPILAFSSSHEAGKQNILQKLLNGRYGNPALSRHCFTIAVTYRIVHFSLDAINLKGASNT